LKAIKKLTGQTAIYGMPSIIGRFLNYWLFPYWTYMFTDQAQMGRIANIYAYAAFMLVILTYGFETGFFRFASREKNPNKVFSSSMVLLALTSFLFLLVVFTFRDSIAGLMDMAANPVFISIMAITIVFDVITAIPFAKLRLQNRPIKFSVLKFINIGINIGLNVLFISGLPFFQQLYPGTWIGSLFNESFGIGYVFLANLIASAVVFFLLIPEMWCKIEFDPILLKKMLFYSFPILIVGITGMVNQNIEKIILPLLLPDSVEPMKQLGIYASSFKMAVILNMFIQAFRFAFEPFFFNQKGDKDTKEMYVVVMRYFILIGLILFLGLSTFVDLLKYLVDKGYREGIGIVPIILMANLFMGIYFSQSLWYKITDKTRYGAYLGFIGSIITVALNFLLIPVIGYYGSAIAILVCFIVITVLSYLWGQKHYPINYDLKGFAFYLILSLVLFSIYWFARTETDAKLWLAALVNLVFLSVIFFREKNDLKKIIKS